MTLRLSIEDDASAQDRAEVRGRLDEGNMAATGRRDWFTLTVLLRDEAHRIRGGALANVWASWLHVDILWVDDDCRGLGWGARCSTRWSRKPATAAARMPTSTPSASRPAPPSTSASATVSSGCWTIIRRARHTTSSRAGSDGAAGGLLGKGSQVEQLPPRHHQVAHGNQQRWSAPPIPSGYCATNFMMSRDAPGSAGTTT